MVERRGDAGDVEAPVGFDRPVAVGGGEPVEVGAEQTVVHLAGPLGQPAQLAFP
ncbi:MAG: hypothetical protein ACRD0W_14825 [Acidimicrobiales bacterium]